MRSLIQKVLNTNRHHVCVNFSVKGLEISSTKDSGMSMSHGQVRLSRKKNTRYDMKLLCVWSLIYVRGR